MEECSKSRTGFHNYIAEYLYSNGWLHEDSCGRTDEEPIEGRARYVDCDVIADVSKTYRSDRCQGDFRHSAF